MTPGEIILLNTFGTVARTSSAYQDALAWLYRTQCFGIKLGLENIQGLLRELSLPAPEQRVIHVAGTNGKGSVCAMIDSICRAQGYRTGLFTSPHLVTYRERIRVNGEMISQERVAEGLTMIRDLIKDWEPHPTFFEITTALGLIHFKQCDCELVILETGLGGRLDATNAVRPVVSVITPIGYDHQSWLGNTLEEIAGEKAGIIQPHIPVVSAEQEPAAAKVIQARAADREAPLQIVTEPYTKTPVALNGAHQKKNAALAIAALQCGGIGINPNSIARGLRKVDWPARFECWDNRTIIDGAHNPAGAKTLAETWREKFGDERATIILAVLRDKDVAGIWRALAPIAESVMLPKIQTERALPADTLAETILAITPKLPFSITASIAEAFDQAQAKPSRILVTGSLHFAGEFIAALKGQAASFEECGQ